MVRVPNITWIKSKGEQERWLLLEKWSLFCFAIGQIVNTKSLLSEVEMVGFTLERKGILDGEGWPNLQCQTWKELLDCLIELRMYKTLLKYAQGIGRAITGLVSTDFCQI